MWREETIEPEGRLRGRFNSLIEALLQGRARMEIKGGGSHSFTIRSAVHAVGAALPFRPVWPELSRQEKTPAPVGFPSSPAVFGNHVEVVQGVR